VKQQQWAREQQQQGVKQQQWVREQQQQGMMLPANCSAAGSRSSIRAISTIMHHMVEGGKWLASQKMSTM
jgi:polyphosphate kinase 2 (PPK2 family)